MGGRAMKKVLSCLIAVGVLVLAKGYNEETFFAGPLVAAMRDGLVLFVNELNRMPESVQKVLLPALY